MSLLIQITALVFGSTPAQAGLKNDNRLGPQVLYFVKDSDRHTAIISTVNLGKLTAGTLLDTTRIIGAGRSIRHLTGRLKVIQVWKDQALAKVMDDNSDTQLVRRFDKFGVMAGDSLSKPKINIAKINVVLPLVTLSYVDLFVDPNSSPSTFELSESGMTLLNLHSRKFADKRIARLFIGGHTDRAGDHDENQIESYQRAMTIKQYLIGSMDFDSKRLTALGFGESDPIDRSNVLGQRTKNRRIELKASSL